MSIIAWLQQDPLACIVFMLYRTPAVILALVLHEVSHGYIAKLCGDTTAEDMGRLSLNPLHHLDVWGTICMFLFGFGWAKAVPVNPRNFRHKVRDDFFVSIAGITMNLILFLLTMLVAIGVNELIWDPSLWTSGYPLAVRSDFLSINGTNFNLILESSGNIAKSASGLRYNPMDALQYMRTPWLIYVQRFLLQFMSINLGLAVFNLLPIPPLDGFHIFNDVLLRGKINLSRNVFQICMVLMMAVCFFTDFVSDFMSIVINFVQGNLLHFFLTLFGLS